MLFRSRAWRSRVTLAISESPTHVVIAVEIAKVTLLRHARFLRLLLEAAAPPGIGDHE